VQNPGVFRDRSCARVASQHGHAHHLQDEAAVLDERMVVQVRPRREHQDIGQQRVHLDRFTLRLTHRHPTPSLKTQHLTSAEDAFKLARVRLRTTEKHDSLGWGIAQRNQL